MWLELLGPYIYNNAVATVWNNAANTSAVQNFQSVYII